MKTIRPTIRNTRQRDDFQGFVRNVLFVMLALAVLAGCTHNRHRTAEAEAYYKAQADSASSQKPLFELRAQPGQTITLQGVESLVVNDPRQREVREMSVQRSQWLDLVGKLVGVGAGVYQSKIHADQMTDLFQIATSNAGDHSNTTITDSYNDQSDHSQAGDTITDSNVIAGDVSGDGAGIGSHADTATTVGDGSAVGDGNGIDNSTGDDIGRDQIIGDRNNNTGRQDSGDDNRVNPDPVIDDGEGG